MVGLFELQRGSKRGVAVKRRATTTTAQERVLDGTLALNLSEAYKRGKPH